jgi:hypothetical protein
VVADHSKSTTALLNTITAALPQIGAVIREARRDAHGEVNDYMELHGVTDWLIDTVRRDSTESPAAESMRQAQTLLQILESNFEVGDQNVDDLISAAVLEHLWLANEVRPRIRAMLPPKMAAWYSLAVEPDGT